jgi:phage-related protein
MTSPGGKEVGRISIRVVPDTSRFREELKAQLDEIERTLEGKVKLDADLNDAGIREKLAALTADSKQIKIKPDIEVGDAVAKLATLRAALDKDAKLDVKVNVDKNSVQRGLEGIGSKIASIFGGAGVPEGGGGGGGFNASALNLTNGVGLVAAVAALLAPALALVSGALVSLPALFSAVAIPIGAVVLGLQGLKNAAKVLLPDLKDLKQTMSQRFQDVFTPILTKAKDLFPALKQSLPAVATAIGTVASAFVNTVTSAAGLDRIKSIIGSVAQTITAAAPGVADFTNGFLTLADKVAAKLPAVAQWFDNAGKSLSGWVTKITTPSWFGKSPLDTALANFGNTIKPFLDLGGNLLTQGFKFLSDPNFGKSMSTFVSDLKDLVTNVLPSLGTLFSDLASSVHDITTLVDEIKNFKQPDWMKDPTPNKKDGTNQAGPNALSSLPKGSDVLQQTRTSWDAMIATFQAGFTVLWAAFKAQAIQAFTEVAGTASSILSSAWATITSAAAAAWNGVTSIVSGVISSISGLFSQVPAALQGAWSSISGIAAGAWSTVVSAVAQAMAQAVAAMAAGAANIVSEAAAIPGKIASAIGSLGGILVAAGKSLMDGLLSGIKAGLDAVLNFAAGIAAKIAAVKGPISVDKTILTPNGQALMQGLQAGIDGGLQGVLARAKTVAQQIADAINSGTSGVDLGVLPEQLKKSMAELGLESKQLQVQLNETPKNDKNDRKILEDQLKQVKAQKDALSLQSDQLGFAKKYGDQTDKNNKLLSDSVNRTVSIGKNFAQANISQFESDVGISGQGAIPQLAGQGVDFLTTFLSNLMSGGLQTHIHVNSVDEAMAVKQNTLNKQALQWNGR